MSIQRIISSKLRLLFKFFIRFFFSYFTKGYRLHLIEPVFLGSILTLCILKLNKINNLILIFNPYDLFFKKKYINYLIFEEAYRKINNIRKISFIRIIIWFLYFKSIIINKKNYFHQSIHLNEKFFSILSKNKEIIFDPVLTIEDKLIKKILKKKFILFSTRDSSYKKYTMKNRDSSYHSYRNESLFDYENSLSRFHNKEMNIVRMGSIVEKKISNRKIIDYSNLNCRNENNDLLLVKNCFFYVGTGSGPDTLAINYQKPIVYVNWPHLPYLFTFKDNVVVIFKKIFDNDSKKFISFKQLLDKNFTKKAVPKIPVGVYFKTEQYRSSNLTVFSNSYKEIYYAVKEMKLYLEGKYIFNADYQENFRKLYYKSTGIKSSKKFFISDYFYKKYFNLF